MKQKVIVLTVYCFVFSLLKKKKKVSEKSFMNSALFCSLFRFQFLSTKYYTMTNPSTGIHLEHAHKKYNLVRRSSLLRFLPTIHQDSRTIGTRVCWELERSSWPVLGSSFTTKRKPRLSSALYGDASNRWRCVLVPKTQPWAENTPIMHALTAQGLRWNAKAELDLCWR